MPSVGTTGLEAVARHSTTQTGTSLVMFTLAVTVLRMSVLKLTMVTVRALRSVLNTSKTLAPTSGIWSVRGHLNSTTAST